MRVARSVTACASVSITANPKVINFSVVWADVDISHFYDILRSKLDYNKQILNNLYLIINTDYPKFELALVKPKMKNYQLVKRIARNLLEKLPYCGKLIRERQQMLYPPGHFYSPLPLIEEIKLKEQAIFASWPRTIPSIDLNEAGQLTLLEKFKEYYQELPFSVNKVENLRYFFEGEVKGYGYSDAITLYCMIRYLQPQKIIEVGCGKSSCVTLDTNELFFNNSISCTFIEPYPQKFFSLIKKTDLDRIEVIPKKLQEVELSKFSTLSAGDILFIDSTHVAKVNSDINYIFFKILPHLPSGVYIHFHDIFYPFEYPKEWIYSGVAWNEAYLLRTFLQYNNAFKIMFFNSFLIKFHEQEIRETMPWFLTKAGNILIKKCN